MRLAPAAIDALRAAGLSSGVLWVHPHNVRTRVLRGPGLELRRGPFGLIASRLQRLPQEQRSKPEPAATSISNTVGRSSRLADTTLVLYSRAVLLAGRVLAAVIPPDRRRRPSPVDTVVLSPLRKGVRVNGAESQRLGGGCPAALRRPGDPTARPQIERRDRLTVPRLSAPPAPVEPIPTESRTVGRGLLRYGAGGLG